MVLARAALIAALSLAVPFAGTAMAQPPWSASERSAARAALGPAAETLDPPHLEAAVIAYAETEAGQRIKPGAIDRLWAIDPPYRPIAEQLAAARAEGRLGAWLADLSPSDPAYRGMQVALSRYRGLSAAGGWERLPPGGVLVAGAAGPQVAALRTRLALEGYVAAASDRSRFDPGLSAQLSAYQADRGLPAGGRLDTATRAALDLPITARVATLEANLERWRWLPHAMPAARFELNIAAAEGRLVENGAPILEMRAVVGDLKHKTPMFASALTGVVFDPPWIVPADIAAKEILPKAARDPGYLARNDFVLTDGRLQQLPGPKNALGAVKFDLQSPFGVYLHDTPAKALFARSQRALSHGCMRLEKPQDLAEALLGRQGWSSDAVAEAMEAGRTQATTLRTPLPLYVLYWTADVSAEGRVRFRPDVYGWDKELLEALARAHPAAGGPPAPADCGS